MIECPVCRIKYVDNTVFCTDCGLYLLESEQSGTDPLENMVPWMGEADPCHAEHRNLPGTGPLLIRLRIAAQPAPSVRRGSRGGARPVRPRTPRVPSGLPVRGARSRVNQRARLVGQESPGREVELPLVRPIRLGRMDPVQSIYPEIDLTDDLALAYGVSRRHACIFRRGNDVEVEDLGSINGTLLNGKRLAPYIPEPLKDGDQLQLGKLLIEVCLQIPGPPNPASSQFPHPSLVV